MLESKLLINRYITLPFSTAGITDQSAANFQRIESPPYYLKESKGLRTKSSQVIQGDGPKPHRRFVWLPWIPGQISEIELRGVDVLTGPMSGCKIAIYHQGESTFVGHIGTLEDRERTAAVKATWNTFAQQNLAEAQCFDPMRAISYQMRPNPGEIAGPTVFCLVTASREVYAVCAYEQGIGTRNYRIVEVRRVMPMGTTQIS